MSLFHGHNASHLARIDRLRVERDELARLLAESLAREQALERRITELEHAARARRHRLGRAR